jgi:hypothetical protein
MTGDEHTTLAAWLDFQRHTLMLKCEGLDENSLRSAAAPPSALTLQGLVQHLTEVERHWFRRVVARQEAPPLYGPAPEPGGHDGGFVLVDGVSFADAAAAWSAEVDTARAVCAGASLDATSAFMGTEVSLRWIYVHMIGEYARHNGHADLLRERVDGATGV